MWVQVTHKVDSAPKASTNKWRMNMMKYQDAWLAKGAVELIREMQSGEQLSIRLDRNGTVFRFSLKESNDHLRTITAACVKGPAKPASKPGQ
jgi:hypothetical protein